MPRLVLHSIYEFREFLSLYVVIELDGIVSPRAFCYDSGEVWAYRAFTYAYEPVSENGDWENRYFPSNQDGNSTDRFGRSHRILWEKDMAIWSGGHVGGPSILGGV
ncbi:hypothetical protein BOTCAL_0221g00150 [Botryotinia calthae]|uniref:Uncharacterized protein n=1 Tax=Botryotinia calthae TaxID=38488 RepID=A0A4Y8CY59_9HELO|nr:hypothetical protein BOTCAL_0221g00150 [Botryotinia calthae]